MEYKSPLNKYGLTCINTPGLGEKISSLFGVTSIIKIPPGATTFETCGHTGCDIDLNYPSSLGEEVLLAFENVDKTLKAAGVEDGWQAVYKMTSYHVGKIDDAGDALEKAMSKYLGDNRPAWCGISVVALSGTARMEITVSAAISST